MLSFISLRPAWIKLSIAEETLFLFPTSADVPSEDPIVFGKVTVYVPTSRKLRSLVVTLTGIQDLGWQGERAYESSACLERSVSLIKGTEGELLLKGEHTFEFSIIVPAKTTPYERCSHGRVRHFLSAKAKGIANLGGDIESTPEPLFLMLNPGGVGVSLPPPPLDLKLEGLSEDLGPYTIALQSSHVTVAGLLLFRFALPSPPLTVQLISLKVKIIQHFTVTSASTSAPYSIKEIDPRTVFKLDYDQPGNEGIVFLSVAQTSITKRDDSNKLRGRRSRGSTPSRSGSQTPTVIPPLHSSGSSTPTSVSAIGSSSNSFPFIIPPPRILHQLSPTTPFKMKHLTRLMNDDQLRPSTMAESEGSIKISHEISVEVHYKMDPIEGAGQESVTSKKESNHQKVFIVTRTRPLNLYSCCCYLDSLILPLYSVCDPNPAPHYSPPCVCSLSLSRLIELQGESLLREEGELGITYGEIDPSTKLDTPDSSRGGASRSRSRVRVLNRVGEEELRRAVELSLSSEH